MPQSEPEIKKNNFKFVNKIAPMFYSSFFHLYIDHIRVSYQQLPTYLPIYRVCTMYEVFTWGPVKGNYR